MNTELQENYDYIRAGGSGLYEQKRGLIAVRGKEAVQFLDGLISNDMKTLEDGAQMLAAFPNAQGRLLAVVRVLRQGDKFLFDTEELTRENIFQNLFRFTFAGDFFVEDLSENYHYFEIYGDTSGTQPDGIFYTTTATTDRFIENDLNDDFIFANRASGAIGICDEIHEILRIENGIPKYGVDMDETTIVPELGIDGLISYNKGCYIGQEIIARIHFRGHVAKRLTGLESEPGAIATGFLPAAELTTTDGKNAGRITSVKYSPKLDKTIALAFVRYDHLAEGTELNVDGHKATVKELPFIR